VVSTNRNDQPMTPEEVDGMNAHHSKAHQVVTEVMHNRVPRLDLAQAARDEHEDLLAAARLTLRLLENLTAEQYSRGEDQPARDALRAAIEKAVGPEVPA